jgi:hypothetical protein
VASGVVMVMDRKGLEGTWVVGASQVRDG